MTFVLVKFILTSRDLFLHRPNAEVFTYAFVHVFRQGMPDIFKTAVLRGNCKECLIAEFTEQINEGDFSPYPP